MQINVHAKSAGLNNLKQHAAYSLLLFLFSLFYVFKKNDRNF